MLNPFKVVGFGYFRDMGPVGLVMAGGILVNATGRYFVMKRNRPVFDASFDLPSSNNIDRQLIIGSAIFGIGWVWQDIAQDLLWPACCFSQLICCHFLSLCLPGLLLSLVAKLEIRRVTGVMQNDQPLAYVERIRNYYQILGYGASMNGPFDDVPFASLQKPLVGPYRYCHDGVTISP